MYCTRCGFRLEDSDLYCAQCGNPVRGDLAPPAGGARRLSRSTYEKKIAGVCAGFARYWETDVTLMRLIWVALTVISGGLFVIVYVVAWMLMPRDAQLAQAQSGSSGQPATPQS